jgi:hypothetical protein
MLGWMDEFEVHPHAYERDRISVSIYDQSGSTSSASNSFQTTLTASQLPSKEATYTPLATDDAHPANCGVVSTCWTYFRKRLPTGFVPKETYSSFDAAHVPEELHCPEKFNRQVYFLFRRFTELPDEVIVLGLHKFLLIFQSMNDSCTFISGNKHLHGWLDWIEA